MESTLPALSNEARALSVVEEVGDCGSARARLPAFGEPSPLHNRLLAGLEYADYERLRPYLDLVKLPVGLMFRQVGGSSGFAYFPTAGIVSPLCMMKDGAAAAVAVTGNDGMIGTSIFMARGGTLDCALVQSPGFAYRLGANRLRREFARGGSFAKVLLQYTHALFRQMAQTAVCNRYHTIEQQFCRWLLMMFDRMPGDELSMTHEMFARILGVRREGVTDAAGRLQKAGIIRYHRGHITMLNSAGLQRRVCECYSAAESGEADGDSDLRSQVRLL